MSCLHRYMCVHTQTPMSAYVYMWPAPKSGRSRDLSKLRVAFVRILSDEVQKSAIHPYIGRML